MPNDIFVNLPVADLEAAKTFYTALGYSINENFTNDDAACIVIGEHIYAMLLVPTYFQGFTPKAVGDAHTATEVINALSVDSREEVDAHADAALTAGGTEPRGAQDLGFMYSRAYSDLDGHIWELVWMDPQSQTDGPPAA